MKTVEVGLTALTNSPERLGYFALTAKALATRLTASRHREIRIIVASEALSCDHAAVFEAICNQYGIQWFYNPGRPDIGRNRNFLLSKLQADCVLLTEDDIRLEGDLDVSDDIDFLDANGDVIGVRYDHLYPKMSRELQPGLFDVKWSRQHHGPYMYSNQGSLWHQERFATLGPFVEDASWGQQENAMAVTLSASRWRVVARRPSVMGHIGKVNSREPAC